MNEVWRSIKDYEGLYEVSNWGRVRSLDRYIENNGGIKLIKGLLMNYVKDKDGYLKLNLCNRGIKKRYFVHRLVADAFIPNPGNLPQVNHIDQNKENNRVENLEWCTAAYNNKYSHNKAVYMYTLKGGLCGIWPSTIECHKNRFNFGAVAACCRGVKEKYKGFKWSYEPPKPQKALPCYDTDTPTSTSEVPTINE